MYASSGQVPGGMDGGTEMTQLKTGDPCPCCGQPIKSRDPEVLRVLTLIKQRRYFPSVEELLSLREKGGDKLAQ